MIESLRMLCLLSITENGEFLSARLSGCCSFNPLTVFSLRAPAKRLPLVKSSVSPGEKPSVSRLLEPDVETFHDFMSSAWRSSR